MSTNTKQKKSPAGRERRVFEAKRKCEAVLAVWAERRKPTEICRDLGIPWQQLNGWQQTAMEAMMTAFEPSQKTLVKPALSSRLEKLLARTENRRNRPNKLQKRLETIQENGPKETKRS